jgi:hypothetical protein
MFLYFLVAAKKISPAAMTPTGMISAGQHGRED